MASPQDRRGFFKELLREIAGVAQELSSVMQPADEPELAEPEPWPSQPPTPAKPARGSVDEEALLELCRDAGLAHRAEEVRRLARGSVRLTRGTPGGASRLGGSPDLPRDFAWPAWDGRELAFLGQLDLAEVAAAAPEAPLPREGLLLAFYDLRGRPSGLHPSHRGSCRAVLVRGDLARDEERAQSLRELPVELSRELMLPGAWSLRGERLEFSAEEAQAWDDLRARLAAAQGIELEETAFETFAIHRLLGYQEEVGGEVEIDCELASSGLDASDFEVYHERRDEHEAAACSWGLLLQLSADDALETPAEMDRLYLCIRDEDLRAGNLDGAWAVVR